MLIGVLSDSHGRAEITAHAVNELVGRGAEMLLHLGDIGTEQVLDELAGHNTRIVFGNCDWNTGPLAQYAELVGIQVNDPIGTFEVDSKRIAFTHGHLGHLMKQAVEDGVDYLLHGHTHVMCDQRLGATRTINPGALFRAKRYTAVLLDPCHDSVQFVDVLKQSMV